MWILGGIVVLQVTASAERGDAHPPQPFTIIYSRFTKVWKEEKKREGAEGGKEGGNERFWPSVQTLKSNLQKGQKRQNSICCDQRSDQSQHSLHLNF